MKPVLLLSSFAHYKTLSLRIVPDIYSLQGGLFIRGVVQWSTGHPNFLFVGSLTLSCDSSIYVVEHSGLAGFRHHPAVRGGLERTTNTNRTMTSDLRVSERSCSELQKSTILTQMESWLSAGVVRLSPGNALAVGCGHLHVVPARVEVPGSKPRVTLDPGREINDSLYKGCVLLPSVASIAGILSEPGDWFLAKIDLRRGFHHMIASPCSRHRFIWKGDIFEFMRLPFGPRDGPAAFQRCTSAIGK